MLVAAPTSATSNQLCLGCPFSLLLHGCFLLIMQVFWSRKKAGEAQTPPVRPLHWVSTGDVKPMPLHLCALLRKPDTKGGRALHALCSPSRFPQLGYNLLRSKYRATRLLGGYLNPWVTPGILKMIFNIFLPSKLSWLLGSAVKSPFSAVSCHLDAKVR